MSRNAMPQNTGVCWGVPTLTTVSGYLGAPWSRQAGVFLCSYNDTCISMYPLAVTPKGFAGPI